MIEQPDPIPNAERPTWEAVIDDLQRFDVPTNHLVIADAIERDAVGRQRYGTPLQAGNGRDSLRDAYDEAMDLIVYLKNALIEGQANDPIDMLSIPLHSTYRQCLRLCVGIREMIEVRDRREGT